MSPSAPGLGPSGSVPLSESSIATTGLPALSVIGLPFSSTPVPEATTWLSKAAVVGLTTTSNRSVNESPDCNIVPPVLSIACVAPLPSKAVSIAIVEAGSLGGAASVRLLALTKADPNSADRSSTTDKSIRSVPPVFSTTTS